MIDHLTLTASDWVKSKEFYVRALAPLGYEKIREYGDDVAGFGASGRPDFWLANGGPDGATRPAFHIAFVAETRAAVDAFHAAALACGGRDNGKPGLRDGYGPNYYAAFVLDPDGQNVEAVCRKAV